MLRKFLFAVLFMGMIAPAVADVVCQPGFYLVEGYTELEYIETTGNQYINTGWNETDNIAIDTKMYVSSTPNQYMYGATQDAARWVYNGLYMAPKSHLEYNKQSIPFSGPEIIMSQSVENGINTITINGVQTTAPIGTASHKRVILGGANGGSRQFGTGLKVYYFRIKDGTHVVRDFIPARRNSDNSVGMFDIVEGRFYESMGTGELKGGPEKGNITNMCMPCPANTYKTNTGNEACAPCPAGTFSPVGSISQEQCGHILHVGEYNIYMPMGRRTEHGLCTMLDGVKYCADLYEKE